MEENTGFAIYYCPLAFCERAEISLQEEKGEIDSKELHSKVDCI